MMKVLWPTKAMDHQMVHGAGIRLSLEYSNTIHGSPSCSNTLLRIRKPSKLVHCLKHAGPARREREENVLRLLSSKEAVVSGKQRGKQR